MRHQLLGVFNNNERLMVLLTPNGINSHNPGECIMANIENDKILVSKEKMEE